MKDKFTQSVKKYKWGILGCGRIAHKFAEGLKILDNAELFAVASSDRTRATDFARKFQVPKWYTDYESLARDPEVEVVYIATTHNFHEQHAGLCIRHGKAVLCEKPFTVNSTEAGRLIELARNNKVFLMEAMWTRFIPAIVRLRELLKLGIIGEILQLKADFCFNSPFDPGSRVFHPALGGGALLDVGIYPLSFSYMIFGEDPAEYTSLASIGPTGVDHQSSYLLKYKNGAMAVLTSGVVMDFRNEAFIYGTGGYIHLPLFYKPQKINLFVKDQPAEVLEIPFVSTGYSYEAAEVMNCLEHSKIESEIMPPEETLRIMRLMDSFRKSWGMYYPNESL